VALPAPFLWGGEIMNTKIFCILRVAPRKTAARIIILVFGLLIVATPLSRATGAALRKVMQTQGGNLVVVGIDAGEKTNMRLVE
jgi:hypothetical protein